ncbi:MAG TPA: LysR substrate-binding domain-containing protein [Eoetvoesiella sp.]
MEKDLFASRIRLRHIQCFVAIAQELHLGKAADKLRLSQPAISKTLLELEGLVGGRLVERGRFGARLTREGQTFLTHAVSILDAFEGARRFSLADTVAALEAVHIGALPTVAPDILPRALAVFRGICPDVGVDIQIAANAPLLDKLQAGEIDFVLGRMADPQMMAGVSFELLYVEPLVVVARQGHPLCMAGTISLDQVIAYPLIVSTKGTVPRHNTESYLQSRGLRLPANCIETLSVSVARLITIQSDAVWIAPIGAVRDDLTRQTLQQLAGTCEGTEEPVGLLHRSDSGLGHASIELMKIIRDIAQLRRSSAKSWVASLQ